MPIIINATKITSIVIIDWVEPALTPVILLLCRTEAIAGITIADNKK